MTTNLQQREIANLWERFRPWIASTNDRIYIRSHNSSPRRRISITRF